jgi:hypothetical protein
VPLGVVDRFGDGMRGRRLARRSLEALARVLAARFDRCEAGRTPSLPGPVYPEVLRDRAPVASPGSSITTEGSDDPVGALSVPSTTMA